MKLQGLTFKGMSKVSDVLVKDEVSNFETHSLGGGEWSIVAVNDDGYPIKEWIGSNGCNPAYPEVDDLWAEVDDWIADPYGGAEVLRKGYKYRCYEAPDGATGSYSFFMKEAMKGRLHGLLLVL